MPIIMTNPERPPRYAVIPGPWITFGNDYRKLFGEEAQNDDTVPKTVAPLPIGPTNVKPLRR